MGFSKKVRLDVNVGLDSDSNNWVMDGMSIQTSLKSINTKPRDRESEDGKSSTPTAKEAMIPKRLSCPSPPRKRRPSSKCHLNRDIEFFTPPDLELVFKGYVENDN